MSLQTDAELILQVVRGERNWNALEQIGVLVELSSSAASVWYSGTEVAHPDASDIAAGLRRYQNEPDALKAWASVVLAGSSIIDLASLEGSFVGDALLDGLWHAAETGEVAPDAERAALRLMNR